MTGRSVSRERRLARTEKAGARQSSDRLHTVLLQLLLLHALHQPQAGVSQAGQSLEVLRWSLNTSEASSLQDALNGKCSRVYRDSGRATEVFIKSCLLLQVHDIHSSLSLSNEDCSCSLRRCRRSDNINWVAGQPGGARPALSPLNQSEAGTESAPTNGRAPAPAHHSWVCC